MTDNARTISLQLQDIVEIMCDQYCKYPQQYIDKYGDPDIANEIMLEERCSNCPLCLI